MTGLGEGERVREADEMETRPYNRDLDKIIIVLILEIHRVCVESALVAPGHRLIVEDRTGRPPQRFVL